MARKDNYKYDEALLGENEKDGSDYNDSENMELEEDATRTIRVGVSQAPAYRDKWFAVAFLSQLLLVLLVAVISGFPATSHINSTDDADGRNLDQVDSNDESVFDEIVFDQDDDFDFMQKFRTFSTEFLPTIFLVSIIFAPLLSFGALALMDQHAQVLLQGSLIFSIVFNVLLFFTTLASSDPDGSYVFLFLALIAAWYAKVVWSRVPYAASTLKCAVRAVRGNFGLALLALGTVPVTVFYSVFWIVSVYGASTWECMYSTYPADSSLGTDDTNEQNEQTGLSGLGAFIMFLFILSYYWTMQVIANSNRTTIAGVIGTWCFNPINASSFCSTAVRDSFVRSNTYSLGSIAFGSLIVAMIQFIKSSVKSMRGRNRGSCLYCCLECLLIYIERIAQYFHKWAFVYVGLYGYGYIDAGKAVMTLFQQRGCTAIISDNLVRRMLYLIAGCVGLCVGVVCALVGAIFGGAQGAHGDEMRIWTYLALFCGFLLGFLLSIIIMGAVGDSVDAIIVCFAEAPAEFKRNHPALHDEMERGWSNMIAETETSLTQAAAVALVDMNSRAGIV
uniref:Choline transporter-like protein n=1 Tax=Ditylum brightwellii TaxID=49249 RepID=A0A7S1Z813_9STRA